MDELRSPERGRIPCEGGSPISIIALFSLAGRSDAAYAALLLAHANHAETDTPTTLVRIVRPGDTTLPPAPGRGDAVRVVEREIDAEPEIAFRADEEIAAALQQGRLVVLDLPGTLIRHEALRARLDAALVPVGPTPLDEHAARVALSTNSLDTPAERAVQAGWASANSRPPAPARLLACGRGGGAHAAAAFNRRLGIGAAPRSLPVAIPAPSREEEAALFDGKPMPHTLRTGAILLAALDAATQNPQANAAEIAAALGGPNAHPIQRDSRSLSERLRDLSDVLDGIADGERPTPADLADAPVLRNWSPDTKPLRIVTGEVTGHPDFPLGRRIWTSDLYAADPAGGWVRTMSRWYRLGEPAGAAPTSH
ncbi:DUF6634 family protein [Enterovirga aerilata]|uniref:Uncharacterized protein n=1 Tax=Enterovirga aerilata TaxID=2730920 RepID=A0A849I7V6_9HYPH|nr:DUF6634 family protein [Enterovirga sp. DB1703]NNM73854.1 hypothetical protein [Enterovirga sp. DB1703]